MNCPGVPRRALAGSGGWVLPCNLGAILATIASYIVTRPHRVAVLEIKPQP